MGLFDKLFGSTTKDSKTKLRDQFKDERYFKNEIIRFTDIINDLSAQPNLTAFNYWSMGLDDSSFKDHPHYPYDLVYWKD